MLVAELIRSCSHAKVAEAALHSIGPDLVREVELRARQRGLESGAYVALSVLGFAGSARPHDWRRLAARIEGVDMPILTGLLYILERSISQDRGFSSATLEMAAFRAPHHEGRSYFACRNQVREPACGASFTPG